MNKESPNTLKRIEMMQLNCKNSECEGTNFERISGSNWKCVECGTTTTLTTDNFAKK